jgi:hypothetical protein
MLNKFGHALTCLKYFASWKSHGPCGWIRVPCEKERDRTRENETDDAYDRRFVCQYARYEGTNDIVLMTEQNFQESREHQEPNQD